MFAQSWRVWTKTQLVPPQSKGTDPKPDVFKIVQTLFRDAWDQRSAQAKQVRKGLKGQINAIDKQLNRWLGRLKGRTLHRW